MRRSIDALSVLATAAATVALAGSAAAAPTARPQASIGANRVLRTGDRLVSANGRFVAAVGPTGRLAVRGPHHRVLWRTVAAGRHARLTVGGDGQLLITSGRHVGWRSGTAGSGRRVHLTMRNNGVLALTSHGGTVWTSAAVNACPRGAGKVIVVDLGDQQARACNDRQQIRTFPVTTGAVDRGAGTPRGTWRVQAKIRNTTLYPAAGGAYRVHYWMPYDGAYGIHDSPWQRFAYGSVKYRTRGSHGCTHVPSRSMTWLFGWTRIGTTVTIHR